MSKLELRYLILWADTAPDDDTFWRRLWHAAESYPPKTRVNIQALVANHGTLPISADRVGQ